MAAMLDLGLGRGLFNTGILQKIFRNGASNTTPACSTVLPNHDCKTENKDRTH